MAIPFYLARVLIAVMLIFTSTRLFAAIELGAIRVANPPSCADMYRTMQAEGSPEVRKASGEADCASMGKAYLAATRAYPYWLACVDIGETGRVTHVARCVMFADEVLDQHTITQDCDAIRSAYEFALKGASRLGTLPSNYKPLACSTAEKASQIARGKRLAWLQCSGYERSHAASHVVSCLAGDTKLASLNETNLCKEVQILYRERLKDAYGQLPEGYLTISCAAARNAMAMAQTIIDAEQAAAAKRRQALQLAAVAAAQRREANMEVARESVARALVVFFAAHAFAGNNAASNPVYTPSYEKDSLSRAFGCVSAMHAVGDWAVMSPDC